MKIITRAEWGARHRNGFGPAPLPAREVWLHHSVTVAPDLVPPWGDDDAAVRRLEEIGEDRFGGGISYTWVLTPSGRLYEGHGIDRQGAHTKGRNSIARAICWVGNYDTTSPPDTLLTGTALLLRHGVAQGWWPAARLAGGHRDAPGASTACPGRRAEAVIGEINRRAGILSPSPGPLPVPPPRPGPRLLRLATPPLHGPDVATLQRELNRQYPRYSNLVVDGVYGPATDRVVREFQRRAQLVVDGVVGPATRAALHL
jgi:hypothetical protein